MRSLEQSDPWRQKVKGARGWEWEMGAYLVGTV